MNWSLRRESATLAILLLHCSKPVDPPGKASPRQNSAAPSASVASLAAPPAAPLPVGSSAAELEAVSAERLLARIRSAGKKATLVNAWASWCGPCREELPMLDALSKNLRHQGVDLVLVSVDEPEDHGKAEAFLRSFDIRLPAYIAARPLGAFKEGLNPRWPGMLPATFLYDGRAKLRYFWGGPVREDEILTIVEGLLAGRPIDGESDFTLAPGKVEP